MRIKVSPLVVAAALGLLGPAALAEEDERDDQGLAGVWQRKRDGRASSPLQLGDRIEVIPFEGTVLLDDGAQGPRGDWTVQGDLARQELVVDGHRVTRQFHADGDELAVQTTVEAADGPHTWSDTFVRQG